MRTVSARDAKQSFGALLEAAQREAVGITKRGKVVAVLLSQAEFERLTTQPDAALEGRPEVAYAEGQVSAEERERLLDNLPKNGKL